MKKGCRQEICRRAMCFSLKLCRVFFLSAFYCSQTFSIHIIQVHTHIEELNLVQFFQCILLTWTCMVHLKYHFVTRYHTTKTTISSSSLLLLLLLSFCLISPSFAMIHIHARAHHNAAVFGSLFFFFISILLFELFWKFYQFRKLISIFIGSILS